MDWTIYPKAEKKFNPGSRKIAGSNFLSTFLFIFLGLSSPLFAQQTSEPNLAALRIGSIETAGLRVIDSNMVLSRVTSRVGDFFEPQTAAEDVKRIAELAGIQRAWYSTEIVNGKVKLIFVAAEQNIVRSIEFIGNKAYKASALRKKLDFKKGDYLDQFLAAAGTQKLIDFYREKGFAFAEASLDTQNLSLGRVVYNISEGRKAKIASITYIGNKELTKDQLKKIAKLNTKSFIIFTRSFLEQDVEKEITNLTNGYYKRGYLGISIKAETKFNAEKSKAFITFQINEGPRYTVDKITLSGNRQFGDDKIKSVFKVQESQFYNRLKGEADAKGVTKLYHENGFINAIIEQDLKYIADNKVDIAYNIKEGEQFRIGQIDITGNQQTQDKVVRRILDEYDFRPGNLYNADIARGDGTGNLEKLLRSNAYMESATIVPTGSEPNRRDALVTVREGQTGMALVGAGVSADSGVIGQIVIEEKNFDINGKPKSFEDFITGKAFKGAGQNLRISLEPGSEYSHYSVSFTEPYLKDKPLALELTGSSWERERESYDEERLKGFVGFEKRYKNRWRSSIGFAVENVDIGDLEDDAPKEVRDVEGGNMLGSVRFGFGKRLTDDRFNPSSGYVFDVGYEQFTGDFTFGKLSAFYQRFYTIYQDLAERKTVLSTKLYGATVAGDAPVFEKYYAGGSGTYYGIRGFDYRGVSPRGIPTTPDGLPIAGAEPEDPIGSDWIFLANAEVTTPLVGENFALLLFVDTGTVETGPYRVSVGTGLQILIPQWFGPVPMRFEVSVPVMKDDEDDTQVFSFSVGRLF